MVDEGAALLALQQGDRGMFHFQDDDTLDKIIGVCTF